MTAPELKPCPFCGAVDPEWLASHVVCDCGATGPRQDVDREYQADAMRALTDWNRRADLAAVQPAQVRVKPLTDLVEEFTTAVWHLMDNSETSGPIDDPTITVWKPDFDEVSKLLDRIEGLPSGSTEHMTAGELLSANILAAIEPLPDQTVEIDLRAAMMEELEKAASESPWVPKEYYMNEVISDCCAFLREDRTQRPAPRDEVIKGLVDALCEAMIVPEAWYISGFPNISVDAIDQTKRAVPLARAALAAAKAVQK